MLLLLSQVDSRWTPFGKLARFQAITLPNGMVAMRWWSVSGITWVVLKNDGRWGINTRIFNTSSLIYDQVPFWCPGRLQYASRMVNRNDEVQRGTGDEEPACHCCQCRLPRVIVATQPVSKSKGDG
ncbi:MAG: hypothetical protein MK116_12880 [Phycisphaerales bacterium]|nr:hypothetical protein [Phycisphaerales bacterium]